MKAKEIQDLIDFISESGLEEVNIETDQIKLKIKRSAGMNEKVLEMLKNMPSAPAAPSAPAQVAAPAPVQQAPAQPAAAQPAAPAASGSEGNYVTIKSPMIGTFYRSANPESDPFVQVGDEIKPGQTVCIVEAMKLFNEIESEIKGTVVKILVDDASPVEYDQPLFLVDPS
ncbi:acetyl-CoA carboxylase biotin carboxyl carrier protein [Marinigracilibium pacificum]|uniref:Biotin carboxyl carrier protein of acetyl-CoA carboxylase n=1 Tax=Marinigracilibium pacificum TaxID=2729599 RepID=A0A848J1N7_9BACT|nr:acetyl-CoA carboxylase biotin carboxyl carrier protein [Marinigracilibium pacificum]NMM50733.1 acetyl-CoA carboxylase biotin carboxyl carrier protein [Marinigracilibium pacificum]